MGYFLRLFQSSNTTSSTAKIIHISSTATNHQKKPGTVKATITKIRSSQIIIPIILQGLGFRAACHAARRRFALVVIRQS